MKLNQKYMGKFFMPSLKIHADENKLGVFFDRFLNFWDFESCSL